MTTSKNIAAEWSVAYAVSIKRLDSQFMLCLMRLMSWPQLGNMHGDLVDDLRLICALLAKRPMVGFLIARRLKLPVDKTFALLSVMQSKGHITALGAHVIDVDLNALEAVKTPHDKAATTTTTTIASPTKNTAIEQPAIPTAIAINTQQVAKAVQTDISVSKLEPSQAKVELLNSGDVLNQLWRVLNTDIVLSKTDREKIDPTAPAGKEAGDVLSQLWQVLNADIGTIGIKPEVNSKALGKVDVKAHPKTTSQETRPGAVNKAKDIAHEIVLRDVNGHRIKPEKSDKKLAEKSTQVEAKDLMGQLWSVLNTDIAFKRQSGTDTEASAEPSDAKTKEVAEVMSQLWRVLNTEIAAKRQGATKDGAESLSDTTREANDKLSKLWRILDAEIVLKKKPSTYLMTDNPVEVVKKEVDDTSVEAVDRLSQLWNVLNSEIAIALPPERRPRAVKRR